MLNRIFLIIILSLSITTVFGQIYIRKGPTKYGEIIYNIDKK